jgi:hypothetical protein
MLSANDLSQVNNIVLIHLSDSNSDETISEKSCRINWQNVTLQAMVSKSILIKHLLVMLK